MQDSGSKAAGTTESNSQSWWLTLPGLLTGVAAVITAVTGLAVGLHQISAPSGTEKGSSEKPAAVAPQNDSKPSSAASDTPTSQTPSDDGAAQQSLALPAGMEVKLNYDDGRGNGELVYKILSARLEPYNSEKRALEFTVRVTNNFDVNSATFFEDHFRLLVDDVPRAPTKGPSEVVENGSAQEGDVVFEVPATVNDEVVLEIRNWPENDETTQIPFDLSAAEA